MDNPLYITVTDESGDTSIFDPSDATLYVPDSVSFEVTPKFDYVQNCVDGFMEWVREMNTMKALSEVEISASDGEENAATVFPGVSIAFKPVLHSEPRKFYYERGVKNYFTHKAWHRDTSLTFTVMPLHRFSDGADFYIVRVTGNTDTSKQYAHLSRMSTVFDGHRIIDGLGHDKPGLLINDNILGYNYKLQYTAQLQSDGKPIGTIYNSAPSTLNA